MSFSAARVIRDANPTPEQVIAKLHERIAELKAENERLQRDLAQALQRLEKRG